MAAKKKRVRKSEPMLMEEIGQTVDVSDTSSFDSSKVKRMGVKTKLTVVLAFIVICLILYREKGYFVAATVNGHPITRLSVLSDLEKHSGKQSLDSLVTQTLIAQEAKKQNVVVSSSELDTEVKKIEDSVKSQGQDLNTLLSMQGMSMSDLREQIQTQKTVEKILGSQIDPSEKDIDDYIKTNKDTLPKGQTQDQVRASVKDQLRQQNLSTKFQAWITDLKSKANIKYFVSY